MASSTRTTAGSRKELFTKRTPDGMFFVFQFEGGGEIPEELSGRYTDEFVANNAKQKYLKTRRLKKLNG